MGTAPFRPLKMPNLTLRCMYAVMLRAIHATLASAVSPCPEVSEKVWLDQLGLVLSD